MGCLSSQDPAPRTLVWVGRLGKSQKPPAGVPRCLRKGTESSLSVSRSQRELREAEPGTDPVLFASDSA